MTAKCTPEHDLDWADDLACTVIAVSQSQTFNIARKLISARLRQLKLEAEADGMRQGRYAVSIP